MSQTLWKLRAESLKKGLRALRAGEPEGLHDVRVALRRTAATASALGDEKIARRSRNLARSLSQLRQLEIDCRLLGRLAGIGLLAEDAAAGLDARWNALVSAERRKAIRTAEGKKVRRLLARLRRRAKVDKEQPARLELEERRARRRLTPPAGTVTDRQLHRYRLAVKRARYLAEDLNASGSLDKRSSIAREKELQDLLGRWNDVRLFRERLIASRLDAEQSGAVTLALELDRVIAALEATVASARRRAIERAPRLTGAALQRSA